MNVELNINGVKTSVQCDPSETLVAVLRDRLGMRGTKLTCGIGYCGACTVLVDGVAGHSCCLIAADLDGHDVVTIEGIEGDPVGEAVADSFVSNGAIQCGACTSGIVMTTVGMLKGRSPDSVLERDEVRQELLGNMCRCTGYAKIVDAVQDAAKRIGR